MTAILYFVTPKSLVKIGSKAAEFIPVLGPTLDFSKKAKKVSELTDPVSASARGVGILFNYCFGKAGAVSVECALCMVQALCDRRHDGQSSFTAGAQFGNMVMDEILD
jgi:hypothetical protein